MTRRGHAWVRHGWLPTFAVMVVAFARLACVVPCNDGRGFRGGGCVACPVGYQELALPEGDCLSDDSCRVLCACKPYDDAIAIVSGACANGTCSTTADCEAACAGQSHAFDGAACAVCPDGTAQRTDPAGFSCSDDAACQVVCGCSPQPDTDLLVKAGQCLDGHCEDVASVCPSRCQDQARFFTGALCSVPLGQGGGGAGGASGAGGSGGGGASTGT
jgi:hypothetical protein